MNEVDYKLFTTIAKMSQKSLLKSMNTFLKKYYPSNKIVSTPDYILCEGTAPIMLVAHLDTVFKQPSKNIYYDKEEGVVWSPQGLGADDRAGVFAIMKIIQNGFRPHICFTTEEERGGIGARLLTKRYPKATLDIKYIVQLDRQGTYDCVFYYCDNMAFQDFIEKYGFITDWGTFSDISTICPAWKIAGVNLSVGYFNEHSTIETLHVKALYSTILKVQKMIAEIDNAPYFEYIELPTEYLHKLYGCIYPTEEDDYDYAYGYDNYNYYQGKTHICHNCKQVFLEDDVFPVKTEYGSTVYYCVNCVGSKVNWCRKCGEPYEINEENKNEELCYNCRNKSKTKQFGVIL